jgi:glycosyltransferase involved in cell wall biosynthesis
VLHINTSMNPKAFWRDIVYLLVGRSCGCKIVYQVHGGDLPGDFSSGSAMFERILRAVLSMPSAIVLLGEFQRSAYCAFSPRLPLQVAANAIDVQGLLQPVTKTGPGQPLKLVFLGRLAKVKGIFDIVEAVSLLRDQGIYMRLVFAGVGPDEHELRRRIADRRLADVVNLKGPVFGEEKTRLWLESDIFVFPTFHREGLPYALLESMAACTVPVTCSVGAIPDVMEDKEQGLFVQPNDPQGLASALRWLHENRDELPRLGAAARQRVLQNYTVTRLSDHFIDIYSSCTDTTSRQSVQGIRS